MNLRLYFIVFVYVYLFVICLVDLFVFEVGFDVVCLLECEGLMVYYLCGQSCCG